MKRAVNKNDTPNHPGGFGLDEIKRHIRKMKGKVYGRFGGFTLRTALQPIYSFAHKRVVGYEGLARAKDSRQKAIAFSDLFSSEHDEATLVFLDRLCRYIHIQNFKTMKDDINWLFLNVYPQVVVNGKRYASFIEELLRDTGFPPHRTVIEVVENPIHDQRGLAETVEFYKEIGCLVAIDDFGAGHSNFERIWELNPDIVKLDRSMIVRAASQDKIRNLMNGIVSLLHQAGCLVLIEGVETEEQAKIGMECDADFVQGYFFAKPSVEFDSFGDMKVMFDRLFEEFKQTAIVGQQNTQKIYQHYHTIFQQTIRNIQQNIHLNEAGSDIIRHKGVARCYLLMPNGIQIGDTLSAESIIDLSHRDQIRFRPIQDARSADWFRRHYLQRALMHPNQLQISRPYLSITGAHMCITLSMMFSTPFGDRVFCCDIHGINL